jgi:hypothetical protein
VERKLSDESELQLRMLKLYQTHVESRVLMPDQTAVWVSKFLILSEHNRSKHDLGTRGKERDDCSVTDTLHNLHISQLIE